MIQLYKNKDGDVHINDDGFGINYTTKDMYIKEIANKQNTLGIIASVYWFIFFISTISLIISVGIKTSAFVSITLLIIVIVSFILGVTFSICTENTQIVLIEYIKESNEYSIEYDKVQKQIEERKQKYYLCKANKLKELYNELQTAGYNEEKIAKLLESIDDINKRGDK